MKERRKERQQRRSERAVKKEHEEVEDGKRKAIMICKENTEEKVMERRKFNEKRDGRREK
jgi:hypothetical protein